MFFLFCRVLSYYWSLLRAHPSSALWLEKAISKVVLARSQTKPVESFLKASQISSSPSLTWRRTPDSPLPREATMVVEKELWRCGSLESVDRAVDHPLWSCWWGYDARRSGRRPASVDTPRPLLTEGRSLFFLPAGVPQGRQLSFRLACRRCCGGDLVAPSGHVPGGDKVRTDRNLSRTRARYSLMSRT